MSARVVYVHPLSHAEHAAIRRREGVRGVCLLKLPNASLGFLGAPSLLVRLSLRFREKTLKPVNLTGKQIDPGVADAVVGVYGFGDVLCDRLSGTKGKLRGKRVGYLDAVRVVDSVAVGIPRQSTVSVRGVSHRLSSSSLFIQWFMYISAIQISEVSGIRSVCLLASSRMSRDSRRSLLRSSLIRQAPCAPETPGCPRRRLLAPR